MAENTITTEQLLKLSTPTTIGNIVSTEELLGTSTLPPQDPYKMGGLEKHLLLAGKGLAPSWAVFPPKYYEEYTKQRPILGTSPIGIPAGAIEALLGTPTARKAIIAAEESLKPYEQLQPSTFGQEVTYGLGRGVGVLPYYMGAGRTLTAAGAPLPHYLGYMGTSGAQELLEGRPERVPGAIGQAAWQYPIMSSVGGILGKFAPEGTVAAKVLSGLGYGGTAAGMTSAEGGRPADILTQGIIGAGMGILPKEGWRSKEQLAATIAAQEARPSRPWGTAETKLRMAINPILRSVSGAAKKYLSWSTGLSSWVIDWTGQRGIEKIDTEPNRSPELARTSLIPRLLSSMQSAKTKIGQRVGWFTDQISKSPLDVTGTVEKTKGILVGENIIPEGEQTVGVSPLKTTRTGQEVTVIKDKAQLMEMFAAADQRQKGKGATFESISSMPIRSFMNKVYQLLSNTKTVKQAKIVMDFIETKLKGHRGEDISNYERLLQEIQADLGAAVDNVALAEKGPDFVRRYQKARLAYHEYMNDSQAVKSVLNNDKTSPDYWGNVDNEVLNKRLTKLTTENTGLDKRLQSIDREGYLELKDFLAAQEWSVGNPSMFRSRLNRIFISSIMGGGIGTAILPGIGTAEGLIAGMLLTMPSTARQGAKIGAMLDPIVKQFTVPRSTSVRTPPRGEGGLGFFPGAPGQEPKSVGAAAGSSLLPTGSIPLDLKSVLPVRDVHGNKVTLTPEAGLTIEPVTKQGRIVNWQVHDGQTATVSKGVAQDLINRAGVKPQTGRFAPELEGVEEVVKGEKAAPDYSRLSERELKVWKVLNGRLALTPDEARTKAYLISKAARTEDLTKFSQYQLPGGKNYREVLIKAPTPKVEGDWSKKEMASIKRGDFRSSHWDEPNVLAHLRMNDRTTADGKKVLFIEELQSDWARQARENRLTPIEDTELMKIRYTPHEQRTVEQRGREIELSQKGRSIPQHSLLKNWQQLSLKRALKEAVQKGYDYLSWTTGEQQAERYDLSKQVDSIWYRKEGNTIRIGGQKGDNQVIRKDVSSKELDSVVGKEVAQRIRNNEGKMVDTVRTKSLTGEDLKIGGEWAKNLYDRQIPNLLRDLTKGEIENIRIKELVDKSKQLKLKKGDKVEQVVDITQPALRITPELKSRVLRTLGIGLTVGALAMGAGQAEAKEEKKVTLGQKNNNPGNLKGKDNWQGKTGTDKYGHIIFDTLANGTRALKKNLANHAKSNPNQSLVQYMNSYAEENGTNEAKYIAGKMGIDISTKLKYVDTNKMAKHVARFESDINIDK